MHPWSSTPKCPRCEKAVYAAEQVMGPGRKLYHKPCLSCAVCKKRLDSFSLVEHDEEPYCKNCHVRTFGTRDLRAQNLPQREAPSSPTSPTSPSSDRPKSPTLDDLSLSPPTSPVRGAAAAARPLPRQTTGSRGGSFSLRPTRALSPTSPTVSSQPSISAAVASIAEDEQMQVDDEPTEPPPTTAPAVPEEPPEDQEPTAAQASDTEHDLEDESEVRDMLVGSGREPPTSPVAPVRAYKTFASAGRAGTNDSFSRTPATPLRQANTGGATPSAYAAYSAITASRTPLLSTPTGNKLATQNTGTPRWGSSPAPACPRCSKNVYAAEQVRALGRSWHRGCLRCSECGTTLPTGKLSEREGEPYCAKCYNKLHGPAGNGYALLGKAGG